MLFYTRVCLVEDQFRWPAVPFLGHLSDDISGNGDGERRPQPGAALLQAPGQPAGSARAGQYLPSHLHDHPGSAGCPLHHQVAGMVRSSPSSSHLTREKRVKWPSRDFVLIAGIFHSISLGPKMKICPTWRTAACLFCLVSSTSSWPWWSPKVTLTRNLSTTTVSDPARVRGVKRCRR